MASHIASLLIVSIHMNMFPSLDGLGRPLNLKDLQTRERMQNATLSVKQGDSARSIASIEGLAHVDVADLPDTPAARKTTATQNAATAKRDINKQNAGSSGSSETSPTQKFLQLAIPTQPSPSLNAATTKPVVYVGGMTAETSMHAKRFGKIDGPKCESNNLEDIGTPSDDLPTTSSKRPAPNADARSVRSLKRTRLAILGSGTPEVADQPILLSGFARNNSPAQQQQIAQSASYSTSLDARNVTTMPEEMAMPPDAIRADQDYPENPSGLGDQSSADHTMSQSLDLPQNEVPRAAADAALVPPIVHRHNTLMPEQTTVLPFAECDQVQRAESAEVLEAWQPREDTATQSDSESEVAESSYVTADEMCDE